MEEALLTKDLCNSRPSYCSYMLAEGEKTRLCPEHARNIQLTELQAISERLLARAALFLDLRLSSKHDPSFYAGMVRLGAAGC